MNPDMVSGEYALGHPQKGGHVVSVVQSADVSHAGGVYSPIPSLPKGCEPPTHAPEESWIARQEDGNDSAWTYDGTPSPQGLIGFVDVMKKAHGHEAVNRTVDDVR